MFYFDIRQSFAVSSDDIIPYNLTFCKSSDGLEEKLLAVAVLL